MKKFLFLILIGIVIFFAGRFSAPSKVEIHKESDIKKVSQQDKEIKQNHIKTITKIIKKDGTIEITSKIDDSLISGTKNIVSSENKQILDKVVTYSKPNWNVRALYELPINPIIPTTPLIFNYKKVNIGIDYRVLGNVFVSTEVNLEPSVKVGLGFSF